MKNGLGSIRMQVFIIVQGVNLDGKMQFIVFRIRVGT